MNEQWTLSIEDKILLAENVMGWRQINHKRQWVDVGFSVGFFSTESGRFIHYPPHGSGWTDWQPETDEGDAARLMLALPQVELFKFSDGEIKAHCTWLNAVQSKDFCETICRLALAHIRED